MLFTPEMSLLLDRDRARGAAHIVPQDESPYVHLLADLARDTGLTIAVGSMAVAVPGGKNANRSMLFAPAAAQPVTYDKIHMFDVELATGETWRESNAYEPGRAVVTVENTPVGRLGLTICYDLRFPELYRALADKGADILLVPSAFTLTTGKDHWHPLLRARAIETQCWVIAPGQWGRHDAEGKRESYGHSLIVDPWGAVVADKGHGEGLALAEIDPARTAQVRAAIPVRNHRRL